MRRLQLLAHPSAHYRMLERGVPPPYRQQGRDPAKALFRSDDGDVVRQSRASSGSVNVKSALPAAIATYCTPSTAYVIGPALTCPPTDCRHRSSPDSASSAKK